MLAQVWRCLLAIKLVLAVSPTQECVLPLWSPYKAHMFGAARGLDRKVPQFHRSIVGTLCRLSVTLPRFSTDESVSATAPLFRGPGDMKPSVRGRPASLRPWKSGLPKDSQRFRLEIASKFEVKACLVSPVCLYKTEIDVSVSLPRLRYSP
jgi:hypothetical protein